jgi:hypothetical protein
MENKHSDFEQHLRDWLMSHNHQRRDPVEICPGVKLVASTRNAFVVHELIRDGRFGRELGHGIQATEKLREAAGARARNAVEDLNGGHRRAALGKPFKPQTALLPEGRPWVRSESGVSQTR